MSSFYKKYDLTKDDSIDHNSKNVNILKKDFTVNYSDYQKLKIAEQYNKLYSNIYDQNKIDIELNENKKLYNLSLLELIKNAGPVYIKLLNDLTIYFSKENKNKSLNNLGLILIKDQNLLYIGLLILVLSFFLWLIEITK
jgi:hypothetical protein